MFIDLENVLPSTWNGWISLGYFDYPNYTYIKRLKGNFKNINSRASIKAVMSMDRTVNFYPDDKMNFTVSEVEAMFKCIAEFMTEVQKRGFKYDPELPYTKCPCCGAFIDKEVQNG